MDCANSGFFPAGIAAGDFLCPETARAVCLDLNLELRRCKFYRFGKRNVSILGFLQKHFMCFIWCFTVLLWVTVLFENYHSDSSFQIQNSRFFASGKLCSAPSEAHPSEDSLGKMFERSSIHIFLILGEYILCFSMFFLWNLCHLISQWITNLKFQGGPFAEPFSKHFDIPCGFGLQLLGSRYIRDFLWHWGKTMLNQPHHDFA